MNKIKLGGSILGWTVAVLSVFVLFAVLGFGWRWITAEPKGRLDAREQILSGDNRIAQYDHFFNLCASIQTNEAQLDAFADELDGNPSAARKDIINSSITGVTAARASAINQYNADASKDYTSGQFLDSDLPFQIPATPHEKGQRTKCAA